ncbi:MAG: hypothetical protein H7Y17_05410 [Chlorobia bacterium]|nr:hypothetical protein [Fimbriimonadaceae bacterium]
MNYSILLPIHVAAGALAIILGGVALSVRKGGTIHRRSGMLFVYAMIVMGITASTLEILRGGAVTNLVSALLSVYFVGTAVTTVRPATRWTRAINIAALIVAIGLAFFTVLGGVKTISAPGLSPGGVPFRTIGMMSFILVSVLSLAAIGDIRIMRKGMPQGGARLARHLWRMCFALFIAAGSFFSIRERVAKILPEPITTGPMRALPILLIFAAMFYWLWRVRSRRPLSVVIRGDSTAPPGLGDTPRLRSILGWWRNKLGSINALKTPQDDPEDKRASKQRIA